MIYSLLPSCWLHQKFGRAQVNCRSILRRVVGSSWRGRRRRGQEADMAYLEQVLREDERTYTSPQLAERLEQERHIHLNPDYLRQVLKKRG